MQSHIKGTTAFRYLEFDLDPGDRLFAEGGSMSSMSPNLGMKVRLMGGWISSIARKILGNESLFISEYSNLTSKSERITLASPCPGDVLAIELKGESICVEPGAYICSTPGVKIATRWAGITAFLGKFGLFKLLVSGEGTIWIAGYGGFVERALDGEFIVDTGHLVAYDPGIKLQTRLAAGIFSSFFGGEGLVMKLQGKGKIFLQTRSLDSLATWVNPHLF